MVINKVKNSKIFQTLHERYNRLIYDKWVNLVAAVLLTLMIAISVACFLLIFYFHYQLLFLCHNALFSFLMVSISIIVTFCIFHLVRVVLMFRQRAKENPNKSRLGWFTNLSNYEVENDEDDENEQLDLDSEQEEEENENPDKMLEKTYYILESRSEATKLLIFIAQVLFLVISIGFFLSLLLYSVIIVPKQQLTLPQYKGTLKLKANFKGVNPNIVREVNGMVHIIATEDYDAFFGQGVAHAQDRSFQLEYNMRIAAGTLSEISGHSTLDLDIFARTVGFRNAALRDLAVISAESLNRIQAYCDGINSYINSKPHVSPTFGALKEKPTEWSPIDVLATFKYYSWLRSANHDREILRYKLLQKGLSVERIEELLPHHDSGDYVNILTYQDLNLNLTADEISAIEKNQADNSGFFDPLAVPNAQVTNYDSTSMSTNFDRFGMRPFTGMGSNSWVISGKYAKRGKPLLSNDPHYKYTAPGFFYLNHIKGSNNLDVIGASFIGIPGILIGRNKYISWGTTDSYADAQDVYALQMDANGRYIHNGIAYDLVNRTEEIKVKGRASYVFNVSESIYGPIINELYGVTNSTPLSLCWTALQFNDTTIESFHKLNYAKSYTDFVEALRGYIAPSKNFVYADTEGNIAYRLAGTIPQRKRGHNGRYIVVGNGTFDHIGVIEFEQMPQVLNPARGYIITAGNRVAPAGYNYSITQDYYMPWRAMRIQELIQGLIDNNVTMNWQDMSTIQLDVKSKMYEEFRFIFQNMSFGADVDMNLWRSKMIDWDAVEKLDIQEPSLFEGWLQEVASLVQPETGLAWKEPTFLHNAFVNEDYSCSRYYNLTCLDFAKQSMMNAITQFRKVYGKVPLWGIEAHTAHFSPPAMLNTKLKCMVSRDVLVAGGMETINTAEPTNQDLVTQDGVIYRQIIDMANNYQSVNGRKEQSTGTEDLTDDDKFVIPLGQSGNYFSPYFENLFKFWYNGEYIDMKMDGYQIRYKLVLLPN